MQDEAVADSSRVDISPKHVPGFGRMWSGDQEVKDQGQVLRRVIGRGDVRDMCIPLVLPAWSVVPVRISLSLEEVARSQVGVRILTGGVFLRPAPPRGADH